MSLVNAQVQPRYSSGPIRTPHYEHVKRYRARKKFGVEVITPSPSCIVQVGQVWTRWDKRYPDPVVVLSVDDRGPWPHVLTRDKKGRLRPISLTRFTDSCGSHRMERVQ